MTAFGDVADLVDYAKARPTGFDREDLAIAYGWNRRRFTKAVHATRVLLGDDDTMNLICEPNGLGPWTYRLVGDLEGELWWRANRQADTLTRLQTIRSVNRSLVAGSSGRTIEGKRVRLIDKTLARLMEDLAEITPDLEP